MFSVFSLHVFGNLDNGGNAGVWCCNGNNALGNANWNIGSRRSGWLPHGFKLAPRLPRARRSATGHARSEERNGRKTTGLVAYANARQTTREGGLVLKRYCKGLVVDRALVAEAYEAWRSGEAGRRNAWRVAREHGGADALVDEILWQVTCRTLEFRPIRRRTRVEPTNGKVRVIGSESVKQQVVDYLIVLCLRPLLDARLGFWQVAGVRGKGQASCRRVLRRWSHEGGWHVKGDIRKCYGSISHGVLMGILRRYVASEDVLYMVGAVLATYDGGGLEIGSYFSQQMAQLVVSFAYHFVESLGKVRRGRWVPLVRHQIWHMDDYVLCGGRKADVKRAAGLLQRYLRERLGLEVKFWKVRRTSRAEPLDLGGWVVRELPRRVRVPGGVWLDWRDTRTRVAIRGGTFLRARRAFRRFARRGGLRLARRCCSYWGWFKHSDSEGYVRDNGIRRLLRAARAVVAAADRKEALSACPA